MKLTSGNGTKNFIQKVIIDKSLAKKEKSTIKENIFIFTDEICKFPLGNISKLEMYAYSTLNGYLQETGNDKRNCVSFTIEGVACPF